MNRREFIASLFASAVTMTVASKSILLSPHDLFNIGDYSGFFRDLLEEWLPKYMKDVPKFVKMLEAYEQGVEED